MDKIDYFSSHLLILLFWIIILYSYQRKLGMLFIGSTAGVGSFILLIIYYYYTIDGLRLALSSPLIAAFQEELVKLVFIYLIMRFTLYSDSDYYAIGASVGFGFVLMENLISNSLFLRSFTTVPFSIIEGLIHTVGLVKYRESSDRLWLGLSVFAGLLHYTYNAFFVPWISSYLGVS